MCLVGLAVHGDPLSVVLLANRDESFQRPTAPLAFWEDHPRVCAGRDLEKLGTWLGITRDGRFAAVTNIRHPDARREGRSRGALVRDFLLGDGAPEDAAREVASVASEFSSFNLVLGDLRDVWLVHSGVGEPLARSLRPSAGERRVVALSNGHPDDPWPKMRSLESRLRAELERGPVDEERLLGILSDREPAAPEALPHTGVSPHIEVMLSSLFVVSDWYGTRASSVVALGEEGGTIVERSFGPSGAPGETRRERVF
jgi:uncharacterized protein with NRDE domain